MFSAAEDERARERELAEHREEVDDLHRKIGELTAERDYLQRGLLKRYGIDIADVPGRPGKRWGPGLDAVPDAGDPQVERLLQAEEAPAREIRAELRRRTGGEVDVSRRCVAGLMEGMNVRPVYPKPNLSKPAKRASNTCSRARTEKARQADNVIVERCFRSPKSKRVRVGEHGR